MRLRPYQETATRNTVSALNRGLDPLLVMATGLGKTIVFVEVQKRFSKKRTIIVAHREELIFQAANKIPGCGIEMAGRTSNGEKVIVASVQSLTPERLRGIDPWDFDLLIVDEGHHCVPTNSTYARVCSHFKWARKFGVTATPKRGDNLALGQYFNYVPYQYDLSPAIADGYLVPIKSQVVRLNSINVSHVKVHAGELNSKQVQKVMCEPATVRDVASQIIRNAGAEQTLIFTAGVEHAHLLQKAMGCKAMAMDASTPKKERRKGIEDFNQRRFQYLLGCGLFTEGFDAPCVSVVAMTRPMITLTPYLQSLGRGTRTLPGTIDGIDGLFGSLSRRYAIWKSAKPRLKVLDFVGNAGRHKLVTAQDVLGGEHKNPESKWWENFSALNVLKKIFRVA